MMVPEIFASLCAVPSKETAYGVSWTTGSGNGSDPDD